MPTYKNITDSPGGVYFRVSRLYEGEDQESEEEDANVDLDGGFKLTAFLGSLTGMFRVKALWNKYLYVNSMGCEIIFHFVCAFRGMTPTFSTWARKSRDSPAGPTPALLLGRACATSETRSSSTPDSGCILAIP